MLVRHILKTLSTLFFAGIAVSMVAACAGKAPAVSTSSIKGEVFYMNRMALPDNAVITVTLEDVSRADAAAIYLDKKVIKSEGKQVPIPFTLNYDKAQVQANHTYSVRARIEVNGQLLYTTTQHHGVRLDGGDVQPVQIKVDAVQQQAVPAKPVVKPAVKPAKPVKR